MTIGVNEAILPGKGERVASDALIAFESRYDPTGLELRVNFGILTGREATPAELDALAEELRPLVDAVSIVAEHRHEVAGDVEGSVHQVRIEVDGELLPAPGDHAHAFRDHLLEAAERWALACAADRAVEPQL